jgi:ABC-type oligopeptide transport system ATPase subunit
MAASMLEAEQVTVALPDRSRQPLWGKAPLVTILREVSLRIAPGETIGVVGESGSGKSTLGRTFLRLHRPASGRILLDGRDLADLTPPEAARLRRKVQMIFQDSQSSLNPRHRLVDILSAPFLAHGLADRRKATQLAIGLLERVGLSETHARRYPHQLSGGQRQRVGIARAIALGPAYVVADEIVSGLDVSVQAQILALLGELRAEGQMGMIFISHDLSVVRSLCDRVAVLQGGSIVENGPCAEIFEHPGHPYTRQLLRAIPLPSFDPDWLRSTGSLLLQP